MTREEAIKICIREKDCVQGALDACADGGHYVSPDGIITALDYVDALDMAIAALREQLRTESSNQQIKESLQRNGSGDSEPSLATKNQVKTGWISAKDRPPEEWKEKGGDLINYLVFMPEYGVDVGNYAKPVKTWLCMGVPCKVTHWMQLPEPPEVEV